MLGGGGINSSASRTFTNEKQTPFQHFAVQNWPLPLNGPKGLKGKKHSASRECITCHFATEYPETTANNHPLVVG